jgi:hypothetical protein
LVFKSYCRVCIDDLEVICSYEVIYFNAVVMCRKNDYRISFINFVIIASLSLVLYGCENWSLTLREERRLKVSEISPKRDEVRRVEKTT